MNVSFAGARAVPFANVARRMLLAVALITTTACPWSNQPSTGPQANLAWDGPKTYSPATSGTTVVGMGINGTVDVLPAGPLPMSVQITRELINNGNADVAAGYEVVDSIVALHFVSTGTSAGFSPVNGPPLATPTMLGPALKAGDSARVAFRFVVPGCGMYRETLHADVKNVVTESTKADNRALHFFAAPGTQRLQINVVDHTNGMAFWHDAAPPNGVRPLPPLPFNTYTFTITGSAGSTFYYHYYQKPINGVYQGVSGFTGPPPNTTPVAGPVTIQFQLQAVTRHIVSLNNILMGVGEEDMSGQVTAITGDGCFIRQETRTNSVLHPTSGPRGGV